MKRAVKSTKARKRSRRTNVSRSRLVSYVSVPFLHTQVYTYSDAGTNNILPIDGSSSSLITRLDTIAPVFQFYRITKLQVCVYPYREAGSNQTFFRVYFQVDETGVTPVTSFTGSSDSPCQAVIAQNATTPIRFSVPRRVLMSDPQKSFSTSASSSLNEYIQGNLHVVPSTLSTTSFCIEIKGICEYMSPTTSSSADLIKRYLSNLLREPNPKDAISQVLFEISALSTQVTDAK